jgi:oligoribonuclease (3'-5' exoribonuclease)
MTDQFLFLDIETTGIKYGEEKILEIAWILTDDTFTPIPGGEVSAVIDHEEGWGDVWSALREAPEVVRDMHAESLLAIDMLTLPESRQATQNGVQDALWSLLQFQAEEGHTVHLAGFSVHFDETMLLMTDDVNWRTILAKLHHRHLDLSSIKLFLDLKGIKYDKADNEGAHRALNDCREAMWQARIFSELFDGLVK